MAQGKKTGGRDFEPGHPGMGGRPALTTEQKMFKRITNLQYYETLQKYLGLPLEELENIKTQQKDLPILDAYLLSCLIKGLQRGDYKTLELMLNRIIGKPVQDFNFTGGALKLEYESNEPQKIIEITNEVKDFLDSLKK